MQSEGQMYSDMPPADSLFFTPSAQAEDTQITTMTRNLFPREVTGKLGMGTTLLPSVVLEPGVPGLLGYPLPGQHIFTHTALLSSYINFLCFSPPY